MPSFDIISELNEVELRHAVQNTEREIASRFDFKGVHASVTLEKLVVTLKTESDFQVKQLEDMFRNHCVKRGLDITYASYDDEPTHSGKFFSLSITFKQGIEQDIAKSIVQAIKQHKLKVQGSIQGDKVRVTGKNRDDLQACIAMLKTSDFKCPLQYHNFRD